MLFYQMGQGSGYFIERMTRQNGATPPGKPSLIWQHVTTRKGEAAIKVTWIPNTESNPGSHFLVKYKYVLIQSLEGREVGWMKPCHYYLDYPPVCLSYWWRLELQTQNKWIHHSWQGNLICAPLMVLKYGKENYDGNYLPFSI